MDGCSKNSSNTFSRTPMDASEWMKKNIQKCLDDLVDFQMAFKMCCETISTKAKRNYRYSTVCTPALPLSAGGGLSFLPNFQKGGAWHDLNFY